MLVLLLVPFFMFLASPTWFTNFEMEICQCGLRSVHEFNIMVCCLTLLGAVLYHMMSYSPTIEQPTVRQWHSSSSSDSDGSTEENTNKFGHPSDWCIVRELGDRKSCSDESSSMGQRSSQQSDSSMSQSSSHQSNMSRSSSHQSSSNKNPDGLSPGFNKGRYSNLNATTTCNKE